MHDRFCPVLLLEARVRQQCIAQIAKRANGALSMTVFLRAVARCRLHLDAAGVEEGMHGIGKENSTAIKSDTHNRRLILLERWNDALQRISCVLFDFFASGLTIL